MNRIREERKKLGLSMKQLAERLNIAESTLGYWERGVFEPSQDMLQKLAELFGVSVDYLIGRDDVYLDRDLTDRERAIVAAYRARPEMRASVDTLLGIAPDIADDIIDTITKKARTIKS